MENAVFKHNRKQEDSNEPPKLGFMGEKPAVGIKPIDPSKPKQPSGKEALTEKQKYEKMWTVKDYRAVSPGELAGNTFVQVVKPEKGSEVIDFGCGTGRGSLWLGAMGGLNVTMLDFASNCLDDELAMACKTQPDKYKFIEHDLMNKPPIVARYGYCTDVMEHIPPDDIDRVLINILGAAQSVFFRISTGPDVMGPKYLNQPLHLSVYDYAWWCSKFIEHGCTILHSEDLGGAVDFYVSAWAKKLPDMEVNTTKEKILENIKENVKWGCKHVRAHEVQPDTEVIILCGGPSLNDYKDEIIEKWKAGIKVVTVNGTYNWALENGITNVNQCMLDARPFNIRFVEPPQASNCFYFIGSGVDPSVFEILPKDRTFYWHVYPSKEAIELVHETYPEYVICAGGSTVTTRAMVLMRILGFKKQTLYGFDSCIMNNEHHAYEQKENDADPMNMKVMVEGRTFECQPWMALQATEFAHMMEKAKDEFDITVKGDGLIAHVLKTGATPPASDRPELNVKEWQRKT
jgi:hypothetical protein